MEEKSFIQIKWLVTGFLLVALIIGAVFALNIKISPEKFPVPSTDPETGITQWIDAVNQRNIDRVYDLAPDEIKYMRTLAQFKEDNLNNSLLQSGYDYTDYTVIDKKQNGTYAQIIAQVRLHRPANQQNPQDSEIPIEYKFGLYYQHGEWKVWTLEW